MEENALSLARAARQSRGEQLLDLTLADPREAGLPRPQVELTLGQLGSEPFGQPQARAVLAAHLGLPETEASRLILSASTSEAYRWLLELLCDPGDSVVTTSPGYPLLEHLAQLEGVESRAVPLCVAGGYALDPDALESACDARTRAVVLVNPGHPTGHFLSEDELASILRLCSRRHLALVCDEVFAASARDEAPRRVTRLTGRALPVLTFCLAGLSKYIGEPGLKLAWTWVGDLPGLARRRSPGWS